MNIKTAVDVETKQFRSAQIETKVLDEKEGIVQAIVGVTGNLDEGGDIIVPGFFKGAFSLVRPKGCFAHDWKMPISKTLEAEEIEPGHKSLPGTLMGDGFGAARVVTQFNLHKDADTAREAFASVSFYGDEQEWSVGYTTAPGGTRYVDSPDMTELALLPEGTKSLVAEKVKNASGPKARLLIKGTVWEYSPVLFGMNRLTGTESVKDLEEQAAQLSEIKRDMNRIIVTLEKGGLIGEAEPTPEQVTLVEGRTKDAEEAVSYLVADIGTKAGAVFAARNRARLAQIRDALTAMLGEAEPDAEKGLELGAPGVDLKIYAEMEGSWEDILGEIRDSATALLIPGAMDSGSMYPYLCVEATYPSRVVVSVHDQESEPAYFDIPWMLDAASDSVALGQPVEVDVQVSVVPISDGATLSLDAGERKDGQTAHQFNPDTEHPRRCTDCGAGSSRPWHTASEDDETEKAVRAAEAKSLEDEVLRYRAERALGRV